MRAAGFTRRSGAKAPPWQQDPSSRQRGRMRRLKVQMEKPKRTSREATAALCLQLNGPAAAFHDANKSSGENNREREETQPRRETSDEGSELQNVNVGFLNDADEPHTGDALAHFELQGISGLPERLDALLPRFDP